MIHCLTLVTKIFFLVVLAQQQSSSAAMIQRLFVHRQSAAGHRVHRFFATTSVHHGNQKQQEQLMLDALYRVRAVNTIPEEVKHKLLPFRVDGQDLGVLTKTSADLLCGATGDSVFALTNNCVTLTKAAGTTKESRSAAVARVTGQLRHDGLIYGWRNELYPIRFAYHDAPVFCMERAAVPLIGAVEYGVHVNGLVSNTNTKEMKMWIARRSRTKAKYPGMLDHIVAGGVPEGISLLDNVVKECLEEAGIPESIARARVRPAGVVSYSTYMKTSDTVTRAVIFNFDLILPEDFQPKPVDGEVEEFMLWSMEEVMQSLAHEYTDPIKPNCYLVIIDYLVRNGYLSPEVPGYLDVVRELRSGDCR
jgi:isopentenyldiphosphate isomerase